MKKIILSILPLCLIINITLAQNFEKTSFTRRQLSFGLDGGFHIGKNSDYFFPSFGLAAKLEAPLKNNFAMTFSAAFITHPTNFIARERLLADGKKPFNGSEYIPLKIGGMYYLNKRLFIETEAGTAITTYGDNDVFLSLSPGIGASLYSSKKYTINTSVRYEAWLSNTYSQQMITLRATWGFKI